MRILASGSSIIYLSYLLCSALLSFAESNNALQKRYEPHCGWDFGPPDPENCKVAIDHQIPNSGLSDHIDFIPYNYEIPGDARSPVILPQFFHFGWSLNDATYLLPLLNILGDCIISVDTEEPDITNWSMVKLAADTVVSECVENDMPKGGMQALGDRGKMLVSILSTTDSRKPTPEENEAKIEQACEQYPGDDIQFCLDHKFYHNFEGPGSDAGDQVCPQMDEFGAVYCKRTKDCCQGFTCSLRTLKATGAAILLGIQKSLVNAAGVCLVASSA